MVQQLATNTFTTAKWIVSALASDGTHTTIASAITSAASSDTIFIRPGTYTENLTLKAGVNLTAFGSDSFNGTVTINGTCTFTGTGTVNIYGIQLKTNSNFLLVSSGANASNITLTNCYLNCLNNTGISFTNSNALSNINIILCNGNLATTGIGYFAHSGAGTLLIQEGTYSNSGNSTTVSTVSGAGAIQIEDIVGNFPITTSSTSQTFLKNVALQTPGTISFTCGGTGSNQVTYSTFFSDTASAISIGAGATLVLIYSSLNSSNTNVIIGAGILRASVIEFSGTSSGFNVTTISPTPGFGAMASNLTLPCFLVNLNTTLTNKTGAGTAYNILFDTTTYDQGTNITLNSGGQTIFTAPVTGKYHFDVSATFSSVTAAMTSTILTITTTGNTITGSQCNAGAIRDASNNSSVSYSITVPMTRGDTAFITVGLFNGAGNTAGLLGASGAAPKYTFWSGYLVA